MPKGKCSVEISINAKAAFDFIHDYEIRLDWDSMLSEARLLDGATRGAEGVTTRCVGNWKCLWLPIEAVYVTHKPGKVAAVKMTNRPPFFAKFAATIQHDDLDNGCSRVTYIYNFESKPRWAAWLLEPIMKFCLKREVNHRLQALKLFAESRANQPAEA